MREKSYGTGGPLMPKTKLIVDKFSCDQWVAKGAGIDLEKFPLRGEIENAESWVMYDHF